MVKLMVCDVDVPNVFTANITRFTLHMAKGFLEVLHCIMQERGFFDVLVHFSGRSCQQRLTPKLSAGGEMWQINQWHQTQEKTKLSARREMLQGNQILQTATTHSVAKKVWIVPGNVVGWIRSDTNPCNHPINVCAHDVLLRTQIKLHTCISCMTDLGA